jgi:hypothetical protein
MNKKLVLEIIFANDDTFFRHELTARPVGGRKE